VGLAALALAGLTLAAAPGEAQSRAARTAATDGKLAARTIEPPSGPLLAVVSIARQRIEVYDGPRIVALSPVSTGMAGFGTPTGVFSVLQKRRYHESNIYSGAPMPFMQRLTWSGIALHAGVLPGYPASHGCIRLPHGFATELWSMTKVGTRVVVAPDEAPAVAIENVRLPAPRLTPMPLDDDLLSESAAGTGATLASAAERRVVDAQDEPLPGVPRLTPWQRANAVRAVAATSLAATAKAARLAADAAARTAVAARTGQAALRRAELAVAAAERRHDQAGRAVAAQPGPPAAERAAEALAAAEDRLAAAQRGADEARLVAAALHQEAFEAATAAADAEAARRQADASVKAVGRSLEPISVLVSRKTGRVYVRQGWEPVHEAPVAFTEAGSPLGTHVYLATGPAADGAQLTWLSVSLPASAPRAHRPRDRRGETGLPTPTPGVPHETAAGALARFELPEATQRFIADRLWAGATLIVSDQGPSGETGLGTDFIVLTR
jgi:L,D-transpeptidase-like protein